jgi:hypothetical protein
MLSTSGARICTPTPSTKRIDFLLSGREFHDSFRLMAMKHFKLFDLAFDNRASGTIILRIR